MRVCSQKLAMTLGGAAVALIFAVSGAAAQAAPEPDGAALYRVNCRACHGARGVPPAAMRSVYPALLPFADSAVQAKLTTDSIVAVLQHGKGKDMRSFANHFSAAEMLAVAKFVKTLGSPAP